MPDINALCGIFRPEIRAMSAYHVADASGMIKLDAMENPYQWPDDIKQAWLSAISYCELNRYPDPECRLLVEEIRKHYGFDERFAILPGNGSDEIIQMLLMALSPEACVLSVRPTFVMYRQISQSLGLNYVEVPLLPDTFDLDMPAMLAAIEKHRPAVIFIAFPNNPTGNLFTEEQLKQILTAATGVVVIDEAYEPFAGVSFAKELARYDNLLLMRTFSKLGLAGLRVGYLVGNPLLIEQLNKVRLPYNINCLSQATTLFALNHADLLDEQCAIIRDERAILSAQLGQMEDIKVFSSAANFILFKTLKHSASDVFHRIKSQGVLIKNLDVQGGLLTGCLRVTVGKPEENRAFLNALQQSLY